MFFTHISNIESFKFPAFLIHFSSVIYMFILEYSGFFNRTKYQEHYLTEVKDIHNKDILLYTN